MSWHEYFTYDAETGDLIWKERPREHFKSQKGWILHKARFAGKVAGCKNRAGYLVVRVDDTLYLTHRVIWEMHHGPIPDELQIDHKNGVKPDSRIENLRLATRSDNLCNRKKDITNRVGLKGVYFWPKRNKFVARIIKQGRAKNLGYFATKGEAALVYAKASLRYHGRFSPYYRKAA